MRMRMGATEKGFSAWESPEAGDEGGSMDTPSRNTTRPARRRRVKTWLITGAGRGLGLALAEAAVARGDVVIGTFRDRERGRALLDLALREPTRAHAVRLDVTSEAECAALPHAAIGAVMGTAGRVDVLVNNAGVNSRSPDIVAAGSDQGAFALDALTGAALERMMATNAFGALFVTRAMRAHVRENGGVVVNMSTRRASLAEKDTGGNYGYCMSKAALNMATRALAEDLRRRGVVVAAVHPGAVKTAMAQNDAFAEPADAARALLALVDELRMAHTGRFLDVDSLRTGRDHAW
jgi:NAD(P)-dependent dehydrogenase (short-subunit alcohol dehydrogenase family)